MPKDEIAAMNVERKFIKCYFCNKPGHIKVDCKKYESWKANKNKEESRKNDKKVNWDKSRKGINSINEHLFQVDRLKKKNEKEQKYKNSLLKDNDQYEFYEENLFKEIKGEIFIVLYP